MKTAKKNSSNKPFYKKPNKEQIDNLFNSSVFWLLAEPIRIEILKLLAVEGPKDITDISHHFSQDRSVISRHLKFLYEGALLMKSKESRSTIYEVDGIAFLKQIETIADDVKHLLKFCCGEIFEDSYNMGLTYKEYLEHQKKEC